MSLFRIRLHGTMIVCSILGLCWTGDVSLAQQQPDLWRRWAIISTSDANELGVSDLIFAELAVRQDLELVERDELARVLDEQELQQLGTDGAISERLEVGQLTRADALLFLGIEETRGERFLLFSICDCRTGARVASERIPLGQKIHEAAVQVCRDRVDFVRRQYAAGVRGIAAVPPFASQNLVQDYNYLQTVCARLLQNALMARSGFAVVEIEEAEAIGRELGIDGAVIESSRVPLFVRGQFELTADGSRLDIAVDRADRDSILLSHTVPMDKLAETLAGPVTEGIIRTVDSIPAADAPATDLFRSLVQRAATLSLIASWEESATVREAAVLMHPEDVEQRILIFRDLLEWRQGPGGSSRWIDDPTAEDRVKTTQKQTESITTAGRHLEYLMRNRMLSPREAILLADKLFRVYPWKSPHEREVVEELFWKLLPLLQPLNHTIRDGKYHDAVLQFPEHRFPDRHASAFRLRSEQDDLWVIDCLRFAMRGSEGERYWNWDTARIQKVLEIAVRTDRPSYALTSFFLKPIPESNGLSGIVDGRYISPSSADPVRVRTVVDTLAASTNPIQNFYGRCGQLGLEIATMSESADHQALAAKLDALEAWVRPHAAAEPEGSSKLRDGIPELFHSLRDRIIPRQVPERTAKSHSLPADPNPLLPTESRVTFERLPVDGRWLGIRKCTDSLDVLWNGNEVSIIDQSGELKPFVSLDRRQEVILDVQWDGEQFWILTDLQLVVMSSDQRILAILNPTLEDWTAETGSVEGVDRIPAWQDASNASMIRMVFSRAGLLQANQSPPIQMQCLSPGRCIGVARYGQYKRIWMADLRLNRGEQRIDSRIFHTAIEQDQFAGAPSDPSRTIFEPVWKSLIRLDGRETLLIGRSQNHGRAGLQPLAIDIETLKVSLQLMPDSVSVRTERFPCDGGFVWINDSHNAAFVQRSANGAWSTEMAQLGSGAWQKKSPGFVRSDGQIYSPGAWWHRIDPVTKSAELLNEFAIDPQFHFPYFAETAHFGLVLKVQLIIERLPAVARQRHIGYPPDLVATTI